MDVTENKNSAEPVTQPDIVGTAYLDEATGDVYRLRDYTTDWKRLAESGDMHPTIPNYNVHRATGMSSSTRELPEHARIVWVPGVERGHRG